MPATAEHYAVTLSREGFDHMTVSGSVGSFEVTGVAPGTWVLTAVVHDASEEVIASGEASVDVTEGHNNTGTLDLTVSWDPASLIDAVKSATIAPDGGGAIDISDAAVLVAGSVSYTAEVDSGAYTVKIDLSREGVIVASYQESAYIYDNLTTTGAANAGNEYRIRAANAFGPVGAEEGWVEYPVVRVTPASGAYGSGFDLTMEAGVAASIYFTTDGSVPDATDALYAGPVTYVSPQSMTVRAIAIDAAGNSGPVAEAQYTAVLTVTTAEPAGAGSLAEMLAAATDGDIITFDNSYTITADDPLPTPPDWFSITGSVTIDAAGHDIVLDANLAGRHFLVQSPATLTLTSDPGAGGSFELRNGRGISGGSSVTGGVFESNISDSWGGAIIVHGWTGGSLTVSETTFLTNVAGEGSSGSYGGGRIRVGAGGSATVRDALFERNSAIGGGAIQSHGTLTVAGTTFLRNASSGQGGAISSTYLGAPDPFGRIVVSSSVFVGNLVPQGAGYTGYAVVMRSENNDIVVNSTMYNNGHSSGYDAFSKIYTGSLEVASSVLAINGWGGSVTTVSSINTWVNPVRVPDPGVDGTWGTDDDDYGDLRLQAGSAAIDAGSNSYARWDFADLDGDGDTTEFEPYDLDGNPRIVNDTIDQGAYEYQ